MTAIRILVTTGLLVLLVPRMHLGRIHWGTSTAAWLAGGLAATFAGIVASALRWQVSAGVLGLRAGLRNLLGHYLAGLFIGNFLLGTVGGDVVRVARLSSETGESPGAFASVVLERLSGWLVLPLLTFVGFLINPGLRHVRGPAVHLALLISVGTLALLLVILVLAAHPRLGGRLAGHSSWLRFVGAVHLGIERFRRRPMQAASLIVVGFAYQLLVVLSVFLAAKGLGVHVSFTVFLTFFPAVAIAQALPITIGGLGVREGALVIFLVDSGLGAIHTQAITLGLIFYGMNVAVSLLGAPSFAFGTRRLGVAT